MDVSPVLLHSEIIGKRAIINALHPIVSSETGGSADSIGPAIVILRGRIGPHETEAIESAVRQDTEPLSGTDLARGSVNVGQSVVTSDTVRRNLGTNHGSLGTGSLIETAPK